MRATGLETRRLGGSAFRFAPVMRWRAGRAIDRAASVLAMVAVAVSAGISAVEQASVENETARPAAAGREPGPGAITTGGQTVIAGYLGSPYTHASDVRFENPAAKTDVTMKDVDWVGAPFKHPIYYGVRVVRWGGLDRTGVMLDFTHSKALTRFSDTVEFKGLIDGAPAPAKAKIDDMFKHLEFSHGHNTLIPTGLLRLVNLAPRVSLYAGAGAGVSLPHSEIQFKTESARTYEYQYAGPAGQVLAGIEIKLPGTSLFVEYKFSLARYGAPLTRRDGDLLVTDLWRQAQDWWSGKPPPGGHVSTTLASHQVIGGAGVRLTGR
jgi:lipid A oxidase